MGRSKTAPLTLKQRRFVEAYMGEAMGNAGKAYKLAGYAVATDQVAYTDGHRMLRLRKVADAIEQRVTGDPLIAGRVEIIHRLTRIVRGEERARVEQRPDGIVAKIEGSRVIDEVKAAELLDKMQGGNVMRHEVTGKDGKPIDHKHRSASKETLDFVRVDVLGLSEEQVNAMKAKRTDLALGMRRIVLGLPAPQPNDDEA